MLTRVALAAGVLACALVPAAASAATGTQTTWHGNQIHLYPALARGLDGRGVTVAVLDGWIDTSHPDFQGRAVESADCTSGTCTTTVAADQCGQNHGTHVAGTVASSSYGVAPGARLLAIRVLKSETASNPLSDCAGTPAAVAAGISWAVNHGARVINLSLGPDTPVSDGTISAAVQQAAQAGAVVVFSAGNSGAPAAPSYGDNALVVAATGPSGGLATYSQYGAGVSVAAPGGQPGSDGTCTPSRCITSLYPGGRYAVAAGTSMAAPHVAGLAALLLQQLPSRSATDVIQRIEATAHPLSGAGAGLVDVSAALGVKPAATPTHGATTTPRTSAPQPPPAASPRRTATTAAHPAGTPTSRAAVTPTTSTAAPTGAAPPTAAAPSPVASLSPQHLAEPPAQKAADEIPLPLAGVAGALAGLAAAGVLLQSLRR